MTIVKEGKIERKLKNWICKNLNLVRKERLELEESAVENMKQKASDLRDEIKNLNKDLKSLHNQKAKYYMRCRNIIKYIEEQKTNNMTKKHFAKIVDIADGASNDGKVTNRGN